MFDIQSVQRPTTRSRSISERGDSSSIVTRKRKASIGCDPNESEVKRTTLDYIKQLDGE
jgi:hypothetical protein